MVLPTTWPSLALCLLVASPAAAQSPLPARQRQDRRAALPATPSEPMLELYVAAGNLTTATFNARLDPDSLVVDRTRFKWAEASDHFLMLEPFADVGERLIVHVGFKDRALPAKAVLAVVSKADVMDGTVAVDRRANAPEALLAALTQKEAELEELKARYAEGGPAGLVLSGWLDQKMKLLVLEIVQAPVDASGLDVVESIGYQGASSTLLAVRLRNLSDQKPWRFGKARITSATDAAVDVRSVHMKQDQLVPGKEELVVLETKTPPWSAGKAFSVELVDASGQRRLSFNLLAQ